jgi:hypothetical protein
LIAIARGSSERGVWCNEAYVDDARGVADELAEGSAIRSPGSWSGTSVHHHEVTRTSKPRVEDQTLFGSDGLAAKGGGAIKGIGEKFTANPVTGTGSLTIPLPLSPGRSPSLHDSEARFQELADNISQFAWTANQAGWIIAS